MTTEQRPTMRFGRWAGAVIVGCLSVLFPATPVLAAGTAYYLDCSRTTNGNGSSANPWNNVASVNTQTFAGGDSILLQRGTTCSGMLWPKGSGTSTSAVITLGAYGVGALPIINGGNNEAAVKLFDQQYWQIQNIETRGGNPRGISVGGNTDNLALNHFRITNVVVRDVGGYATSKTNGLVALAVAGDGQTLNDVVIDGVTAYNTRQWSGIVVVAGGRWRGEATARGNNITIRNSTVYNVAGDGIIAFIAQNALIENNVVYNIGALNHVKNRGFEIGTTADWTAYGAASASNTNTCRQSYSLNAGSNSGVTQSFAAVANMTYTFGGVGAVSASGKTGWIGVKVKDSNGAVLLDRLVAYTQTSCEQKHSSITTPANAATIEMYLWSDSASGTFKADDLLLQVTPNSMSNLDFEAGTFTNWNSDWGNSQVVASDARSGTYALQIGAAGGGRAATLSKMIGSPWGTELTLSASGKLAAAGDSGWVGVHIYGSKGSHVHVGLNFDSTVYAEKSAPVQYSPVTDEVITDAFLYVWKGNGNGNFFVDDIHLTSLVGTPNGIWTWTCTTCTVQLNEGYNTDSPGVDGGVYDIDWGNANTTVQYNYGHDAAGYCIAVLGAEWTTTNSVVRYNVCANNARRPELAYQGSLLFYTWSANGAIDGVQVYNNTFSHTPVIPDSPVIADGYGSWRPTYTGTGARFVKNNIIVSSTPKLIDVTNNIRLDHNLYWYTGTGTPTWVHNNTSYTSFSAYQSGSGEDANSVYSNPLLDNPTYHAAGRPTTQFRLQNSSPAVNAGTDVGGMGTRDFFNNAIPRNGQYDIGAHEQ